MSSDSQSMEIACRKHATYMVSNKIMYMCNNAIASLMSRRKEMPIRVYFFRNVSPLQLDMLHLHSQCKLSKCSSIFRHSQSRKYSHFYSDVLDFELIFYILNMCINKQNSYALFILETEVFNQLHCLVNGVNANLGECLHRNMQSICLRLVLYEENLSPRNVYITKTNNILTGNCIFPSMSRRSYLHVYIYCYIYIYIQQEQKMY